MKFITSLGDEDIGGFPHSSTDTFRGREADWMIGLVVSGYILKTCVFVCVYVSALCLQIIQNVVCLNGLLIFNILIMFRAWND